MSSAMTAPAMRKDVRPRGLALALGAIVLLGLLVAAWPVALPQWKLPELGFRQVMQAPLALNHPRPRQGEAELQARFEQGVVMLHARQYEYAVAAFHHVLERAPGMPEAHANMGFALLGLARHAAAADFFRGAIGLRVDQLNAYYGLAVALDALGDRQGAIAAMQSYVHRTPPGDPFRRKAEAALWEWQSPAPGALNSPEKEKVPGKG